jgi:hypothetical protein
MATHKVRTTMQPGEVIEVDDAELLDLQRGGLLTDEPAADPETSTEARGSRAKTEEAK